MMKKFISLVLLAAFLVSFAFPAAAAGPAVPVGKNEALKIAREMVEIPDNYILNNIYYRQEYNGFQVWSFNWNSGDPKKPGDMWVEIDAKTGRLRSFGCYSPDNYREGKYTMAEAQAIAEEFIRKMNPDEYSQLRLEPPVAPDIGIMEKQARADKVVPAMDYFFKYNRIVDGYLYFDNYINVGVSSSTGKITSYSFYWDDEKLPAVDTVVSRSQAEETFFDAAGFGLGYLRIWKEGGAYSEADLGYFMRYPYYQVYVDAVTGEAIDSSGKAIKVPKKPEPISSRPLPTPAKGDLTMDEAMALAKSWVKVPDDYILNNVSYNENPQGITPPVWFFSWVGKSQEGWISIGINANTGEITSMDTTIASSPSPKAEITEEEAAKIAEDFLIKAIPSKANQFVREPLYYDGGYPYREVDKRPYYNFTFTRLVNGLPFADSTINVNVTGEGKVTSFWMNWEDLKFPPADNVISAEKAADILLRKMNIDLGYVRVSDGRGGWEPRLVYRFSYDNGLYVDAHTGEVKSRWGPIVFDTKVFSDTAGHWAEKDIRQLVELKVIDPASGTFKPEDSITRGDMIAFIVKALRLNPYFPEKPTFSDVPKEDKNYGYIEAAYREGIIVGFDGKFNPAAAITREELATILAKAFDGLPEKNQAGLDIFKDSGEISGWAEAGVLTAVRLGLMTGDNKGNFNPKKNVTRAEAAAITARAIEGLTK